MPIILKSPESRAAIVAHEIVAFSVNLQTMHANMELVSIDADGEKWTAIGMSCSLLDANGAPRFTPEEYASIKAALYRLALEDGHVAGTVA